MKVYFIPGLGADQRVFRHIRLPDGYELVHVTWLTPEKDELLAAYATRLAATLDNSQPFALVGLSFGGMVAAEISRLLHPETTILIASIPTAKQLPAYYRILAPLRLERIIPVKWFINASIIKRLFTTETPEDKILLRQIISDTDPYFIRWALGAIQTWTLAEPPAQYFHIHGSADRLLPVRYVQPTHVLPGAGHLLVLNRASSVNRLLSEILAEKPPAN